jgi:[protein-PII] uridylyltransferase
MGYVLHEVREAADLAANDPEVFTSYFQARLLLGDAGVFGALETRLAKVQQKQENTLQEFLRARYNVESLPEDFRELYDPEPNLKENVGGLRDVHVARWILGLKLGRVTLDDLEHLGALRPEENLDFQESRDFIWRVRNELHFHTGKPEEKLSFALQAHVASAFGYGNGDQAAIDRFMQDYYSAARALRRLLTQVVGITDQAVGGQVVDDAESRGHATIVDGELSVGGHDPQWFAEYPPRLMEAFWECARRMTPLDHGSKERIKQNLHLVGDAFRSDALVRRFFTALCSRPHQAGLALRQAAETGLLGLYIPEFSEVDGIVRYEDFHSYPVDEHTLRAVEAISGLRDAEGPIGKLLQRTLEHLRDPHILIIAIVCHDLGKAGGEEHVEEGVRLVQQICGRMGMGEDDTARIAFLVKYHMHMNNIAMYRDTDDLDIVSEFAKAMGTLDRLQALLLLSFADLSAVGPGVWTEWKGALLAKLYLKAEQILLGRAHADDAFWKSPKAQAIEAEAPNLSSEEVTQHLRQLGERYFVAFNPEQIVRHMACLAEARSCGLSVRCDAQEDTGTSDVVVCTRNYHGLFAKIAGCLASQLADVRRASVFTTPDGYTVDSFSVSDAAHHRPLTSGQATALSEVLHDVLLGDGDVQEYVDRARNRLFALNQARSPVPTRINFDNGASKTDTVMDIETGDRTGLLYDIARMLASRGIDFQSSHVVTDARQVRDAFYIRMGEEKIECDEAQQQLRQELGRVIQPRELVQE